MGRVTVPTIYNVDRPRSRGFALQLDDLLLRTVNYGEQRLTVESARAQAEQINTSENPEEFTSDVGRVFSLGDATGGEGLLNRHRRQREENDSIRYWDSRGLKIEEPRAGQPNRITLLEETERIATGSIGIDAPVVRVGASINMGDGTNVKVVFPYINPTESTQAVGAGIVQGLAYFQNKVWAAATSALRVKSTTTWAASNFVGSADGVWSANDRLFVASGTVLYEWPDTAAGTKNTLYTLPSGIWVGVVDGPDAVYAAATNGTIYAFAPDDTGALVLIGQTVIQNERPTCIIASQGLVFVGTYQSDAATYGRLWIMNASQGELSGRIIREWIGGWPEALTADRENVFTVVRDSDTVASTWRYNLATGAIFRWWDFPKTDASLRPRGLVLTDIGNLVVAMGSSSSKVRQMHVVRNTLVATGYIISPLADFYTAEQKTWVEAQLDTGVVPVGAKVQLFYSTDPAALTGPSVGWRIVGQISNTGPGPALTLSGVASRRIAGMVKMFRGSSTTVSPVLESFGFRGLLAATDVLVEAPVSLADMVEQPHKRPIRVPGLGAAVFAALKKKERANVFAHIFDPEETIRGQVESIQTPMLQISPRGGSTLVSMVTIRGRRVGVVGSILPGAGGSFTLGAKPFGGTV